MGIPSYFRRILQAYPGCMSKVPPPAVKALCFDFNCLIYRCLRSMPVWSEERSDEWEQALLHEVCRTVKEVYTVSGRPKQVYLAVDGVVPMAKIRQQRVRRFKSVWMRTLENTQTSWDTNAITPGTVFMDKLGVALRKLASEHKGWEVSDVNEPGEGEHKILRWLREGKLREKGDVLVYGLDADLILLTMLVGTELNLPLWLIREKQEFAGAQQPQPGDVQEYQCMNLKEFQERLGVKGMEQTMNYIALMSLMGNDFLPHSLSHKLGDDGHEYVVNILKSGIQLVNSKGDLNVKALQQICAKWAEDEEAKVAKMIVKKQEQAGRGVLKGMKEIEGLPLTWNVEQALLNESGSLSSHWRSMYWQFIHPQGQTREYVQQLCQEYVFGCQWVLDYYTGKSVDQGWMFPSWVPPLWSDIAKTDVKGWDTKGREQQQPIQPQEQLAMVLPVESWNLIRDRELKTLPEKLPQYWPEKFGFFSLGRKWLWECEALIPPLRVERVRGILKHK